MCVTLEARKKLSCALEKSPVFVRCSAFENCRILTKLRQTCAPQLVVFWRTRKQSSRLWSVRMRVSADDSLLQSEGYKAS